MYLFSFCSQYFFVLFKNLSETESSIFPTKSLKGFFYISFLKPPGVDVLYMA